MNTESKFAIVIVLVAALASALGFYAIRENTEISQLQLKAGFVWVPEITTPGHYEKKE